MGHLGNERHNLAINLSIKWHNRANEEAHTITGNAPQQKRGPLAPDSIKLAATNNLSDANFCGGHTKLTGFGRFIGW